MKVAIVGTSAKLSEEHKSRMSQAISRVLAKYSYDTVILSGGADGVDKMATGLAKLLGFKHETISPKKENWKYRKQRNLKIAHACDSLFCFTVPVLENGTKCYHHAKHENHEKTAGCWTMAKAQGFGKSCELIVVE